MLVGIRILVYLVVLAALYFYRETGVRLLMPLVTKVVALVGYQLSGGTCSEALIQWRVAVPLVFVTPTNEVCNALYKLVIVASGAMLLVSPLIATAVCMFWPGLRWSVRFLAIIICCLIAINIGVLDLTTVILREIDRLIAKHLIEDREVVEQHLRLVTGWHYMTWVNYVYLFLQGGGRQLLAVLSAAIAVFLAEGTVTILKPQKGGKR